jgi:glycosyltransferase involved in cell wall biosynthesis
MPFFMLRQFRKSPLVSEKWDGVIWYAPSIFHGPLARALKKSSCCKGYLIIRDIFPEWAVDMGLMSRGLLYRFFDAVARYQYSVADVIGVQTLGNISYFDRWQKQSGRKLEVLQNWLGKPSYFRSSICIDKTTLAGRKVFIYAGNMGVAQGMNILLDLVEHLQTRNDVGFLFVGRGSHSTHLKASAEDRGLNNILFYDEIHPDEIPSLYAQCIAGIVALDTRHKSHNIPGKFLTYIQSGLPVLANVNSGNDLARMIQDEQVGQVCENNQLDDLVQLANKLLVQIESDEYLSSRCRNLFEKKFTVGKTVSQIVSALSVSG